jgi:hypothetical protein
MVGINSLRNYGKYIPGYILPQSRRPRRNSYILLRVTVLKISYFVWMWILAPEVKERETTGVWYKTTRKISA